MRATMMLVLVLTTAAAWADGEAGYAGPKTRPQIPAPIVVIPRASRVPAAAAPISGAAPATAASASVEAVSLPAHGEGFGADTRYWTTLQTSGAVASKDARPVPGEAARRSYERYIQTFTYPIPEKFDRDSFSSSGGGGGGGATR